MPWLSRAGPSQGARTKPRSRESWDNPLHLGSEGWHGVGLAPHPIFPSLPPATRWHAHKWLGSPVKDEGQQPSILPADQIEASKHGRALSPTSTFRVTHFLLDSRKDSLISQGNGCPRWAQPHGAPWPETCPPGQSEGEDPGLLSPSSCTLWAGSCSPPHWATCHGTQVW